MAIQYHMRAYKTTPTAGYVDWVVNDQPDSTGVYSGFNPDDLINITVNKVVQSKTDNWLQNDQGYIVADGKFFHLNSFDQLHAANAFPATPTVIPVPTGLVGIAVTRGGTTDSSGLLLPGAGTNFFSTLLWDEAAGRWKFIQNTNGDHVTQGAYQPVNTGTLTINGHISVDGYIEIGADPADSGIIRIPNNQFLTSESNPAGTDIPLIGADTSNRISIGTTTSHQVFIPGFLRVGSSAPASGDGFIRDGGTTPSQTTGFIRNSNNTNIITFRSTAASDIVALSSNASNHVVLGDSVNSGIRYNTATGSLHQFQTNGVANEEIGSNFIRFTSSVNAPILFQLDNTAASGVGQTLIIQSQNATGTTSTGGTLQLQSGSGTSFNGPIEFRTGGTVKMRIHPTDAETASPDNDNSIHIFENRIRIDASQITPRYLQDDIVAATGQPFTIQAQNATSLGGELRLTSGTGLTAGNVVVQTGGVERLRVSPDQTTIFGNLLVLGDSTTVNSTVVELADRVIHVNSSAASYPTLTPVPAQITGFSVDRGTIAGPAKRNYNGLFWFEPDGYWRFAVNTDGYQPGPEQALTQTLPVIASTYLAQPDNGTVPGVGVDVNTIPTVGGFRSLNNTVHSASRNAAGTQDLILTSTDAADKLIWGAATNNTGHIFRTTVGTIYDFRAADVSTYTLTPQSAGTTTLQATSGVTALVYSHQTTGAASGAPTSLQAQTAATNGGNLILSSGQGSVDANDGYVALETGNNDRIIVRNAFTEFRDNSGEALRVTYVSTGTTQITYASTVTAAQFNQTTTGGATGAPMTFQAQNAATTGGAIFITSGTGTTAGDVNIQTGAVSKIIVHPTFTEFRDTAEAYRITPISAGTTTLQAASTVTAVVYDQADLTTASGTGAPTTVRAQNETGTTSTGGALNLVSGTGTSTNGAINLQVGGVTTASLVTNKFVFNRGWRRNVTEITTTYPVVAMDDFIVVTTLAAPFTITLPASPSLGDSYTVKDGTGNAGTNNLTVDGNGANIDGAATFLLSQPYAAATFTFTNGQWSVS